MIKKFYSVLLMLCLTLPIIATFSWLQINKVVIRKQVKRQIIAGIEKEKLVLLTFTKEETITNLKWKHSKEFEFENQMYDIVEGDTTDGVINYWCWLDNEETLLNKQLKSLVFFALGKNPKNQENQKNLLGFLKSLYFSQFSEKTSLALLTNNNKFFYKREIYQSVYISTPAPPPKNV